MRLTVFTAQLGDTDHLQAPRPAAVRADVHYVCFSDQPCHVAPYEWIPVELPAYPGLGGWIEDPQLTSRRLKILADHPALQAADATLWHDASYTLTADPQWVVDALADADLVAMRHPRRSLIEDEARAIARWRYRPLDECLARVQAYRAAGFVPVGVHPERMKRITSGGLLGRRNSGPMRRFNARWWAEAEWWRGRDQVSLDYCAWHVGIRIAHIEGTVRANTYAAWREAVPA